MQLIRRIDSYFIGEPDEGTVTDRLYFFGTLAATGIIAAVTLFNL
ncbi:hypothetical protein [Planococcus beigongshangi]|nr:hypothetical protein [Planococcus beigongshangi]